MATLIGRDFPDLVLDAYIAKLTSWRAAQLAAAALTNPVTPAASINFDIDRDRPDAWDISTPLVNLVVSADDYESKGSSADICRAGRITIKAECFAPVDKARLPYLKAQTLAGLFSFESPLIEAAFPAGTFERSGWPSWAPLPLPEDLKLETDLFVGEWTWSLVYAWSPDETEPPALSALSIDVAHRWASQYQFA